MRFYLHKKHELKCTAEWEPTVAELSAIVAAPVESNWKKASIPIVSHTRVYEMIGTYHDSYRRLLKPFKERQNNNSYRNKLKEFAKRSKNNFFDIAVCKCKSKLCPCQCLLQHKVQLEEQNFLEDQRTLRMMCIGKVDVNTSRKRENKMQIWSFRQSRCRNSYSKFTRCWLCCRTKYNKYNRSKQAEKRKKKKWTHQNTG